MPFELQGHRGARAHRPENTLPSFEAALDADVSSIETDVHLTSDGVPVLCHDPVLSPRLATLQATSVAPADLAIAHLALADLRRFRVDRNLDPVRFPHQTTEVGPVARAYCREAGIDPYAVPTVADFLAFVAAYADRLGEQTGKSDAQRCRVAQLIFDLELKRVPFTPKTIGDNFDGLRLGLLEERVLADVRQAEVTARTVIRSFDHRSVQVVKKSAPEITTAVLVAATRPVVPEALAQAVGATIYCPDSRFVDEPLVGRLHAANLRVLPWTVNEANDWERLIAWGVDGITTDDPQRLAEWLRARAIEWR